MTDEREREFQNGFEQYKNTFSAIGAWKDGYGGTHVLDYRDLGEMIDDGDDNE